MMTKIICATYTPTKIYFEIPDEWDLKDIEVLNGTLLYKESEVEVKFIKDEDDGKTPQTIDLFSGSAVLRQMVELAFKYYEECPFGL